MCLSLVRQCLTFFSLVRHVSHLFQFLAQTTYSRIVRSHRCVWWGKDGCNTRRKASTCPCYSTYLVYNTIQYVQYVLVSLVSPCVVQLLISAIASWFVSNWSNNSKSLCCPYENPSSTSAQFSLDIQLTLGNFSLTCCHCSEEHAQSWWISYRWQALSGVLHASDCPQQSSSTYGTTSNTSWTLSISL